MGFGFEDEHYEGREDSGSGQAGGAKFPGLLALAGAGVDAQHDKDYVEGGEDVEGFEDGVPEGVGEVREEIQVAGYEDKAVEL